MDDKISIILPIFNVGPYLRNGIDSLINQTIGNENLEIIMVNDCSTDGSDKIIDEYADKYDCCIAIHHETNSGGAYTPRNTGIEASTGEYIMFLDPDDSYSLDTCEKLYDALKKYDADVAFGRYRRVYSYENKFEKSYSPYIDNIDEKYPNEYFENNKSNKFNLLYETFVNRVIYGVKLNSKYSLKKPIDIVYSEKIEDEHNLLKMPPAVWCKLYKRELIMENNIRFQPFISGDDMAFSLEALLNANGIVLLNNLLAYNYFIRDLPDDKSITKNVNFKLLDELLDAYMYCASCMSSFSNCVKVASLDSHIFHWFDLWKSSKFNKSENQLLLKKLKELKRIHNANFKTNLIYNYVIFVVRYFG